MADDSTRRKEFRPGPISKEERDDGRVPFSRAQITARYREYHPERIAAAQATPQGRITQKRAAQRHLAKRRGHVACLDFPPPPKDGQCQCCGTPATLHLDHDHETGVFRGYLCHYCNT